MMPTSNASAATHVYFSSLDMALSEGVCIMPRAHIEYYIYNFAYLKVEKRAKVRLACSHSHTYRYVQTDNFSLSI